MLPDHQPVSVGRALVGRALRVNLATVRAARSPPGRPSHPRRSHHDPGTDSRNCRAVRDSRREPGRRSQNLRRGGQAIDRERAVVPAGVAREDSDGRAATECRISRAGRKRIESCGSGKTTQWAGRHDHPEWSKALGSGLWQLLLSLLIGFFFYRDGQALGARISNLAARVAGAERGERLLKLAQDTCVGVVYGVVGTGLLEAVLMGLGLMIA